MKEILLQNQFYWFIKHLRIEIGNSKFDNAIPHGDQGQELWRILWDNVYWKKKTFSKEEKNCSFENHRQRTVSGTALIRVVFPQIPVLSQVADKSKLMCATEMENHWCILFF